MVVGGEMLLGVLCLAAVVAIRSVPRIRNSPRIAPHRRARIWLGAVFGVLFLVAAASGRDLLTELTGLLVLSVIPLVLAERHRDSGGGPDVDGR